MQTAGEMLRWTALKSRVARIDAAHYAVISSFQSRVEYYKGVEGRGDREDRAGSRRSSNLGSSCRAPKKEPQGKKIESLRVPYCSTWRDCLELHYEAMMHSRICAGAGLQARPRTVLFGFLQSADCVGESSLKKEQVWWRFSPVDRRIKKSSYKAVSFPANIHGRVLSSSIFASEQLLCLGRLQVWKSNHKKSSVLLVYVSSILLRVEAWKRRLQSTQTFPRRMKLPHLSSLQITSRDVFLQACQRDSFCPGGII